MQQIITLGMGAATTLQWHPQGNLLAIGSTAGVYLYAGEPLTRIEHIEPNCWTNALAFSPSGDTLALGCADGQIRLWQIPLAKTLQTLAGSSSSPKALTFSPDGLLLAYGRQDGSLTVWDTRTQQTRWQIAAHRGSINGVAFSSGSADGLLQLASAGNDGRLRLWQAENGTALGELATNETSLFTLAARPEPQGLPRLLAGGGNNTTLRLWDGVSGVPHLPLQAHKTGLRALAFNADGSHLASGDANGIVWVWDARNGTPQRGFQAHSGEILALTYRAASSQLASLGADGVIRIWQAQPELNADQPTPPLLQTLTEFSAPITSLASATQGRIFVSGDSQGTITIWNLEQQEHTPRLTLIGHRGAVNALVFMPGNNLLVSGGNDGTLRVWDTSGQRSEPLRMINAHTAPVWTVDISPDGGVLLSGGGDGWVRRWDAVTGAPLGGVSLPGGAYAARFAPNGRQIAVGGAESFLGVWDDFGQPSNFLKLNWQTQQVLGIAFRTVDGLLAATGESGLLGLWQTNDAQPVSQLMGENRRLTQVLFLGEHWLAAAGARGVISVWDVTRPDVPILQGNSGAAITGLATINDPTLPQNTFLLVAAGNDGILRIWKVVFPEEALPGQADLGKTSNPQKIGRHHFHSLFKRTSIFRKK